MEELFASVSISEEPYHQHDAIVSSTPAPSSRFARRGAASE